MLNPYLVVVHDGAWWCMVPSCKEFPKHGKNICYISFKRTYHHTDIPPDSNGSSSWIRIRPSTEELHWQLCRSDAELRRLGHLRGLGEESDAVEWRSQIPAIICPKDFLIGHPQNMVCIWIFQVPRDHQSKGSKWHEGWRNSNHARTDGPAWKFGVWRITNWNTSGLWIHILCRNEWFKTFQLD